MAPDFFHDDAICLFMVIATPFLPFRSPSLSSPQNKYVHSPCVYSPLPFHLTSDKPAKLICFLSNSISNISSFPNPIPITSICPFLIRVLYDIDFTFHAAYVSSHFDPLRRNPPLVFGASCSSRSSSRFNSCPRLGLREVRVFVDLLDAC